MYRKEGHGAVKYQRSPALTSFNINRCIRQLQVYPKEDTSDSESIIEDVESGHIVELVLVHDEMQGCNVFTLSSHNICSAQWLLQK
ncbi:Protocadherin gamma-A2 [Frankliniella fusca]|uniref:Protocadherin gamma-A2 n=1 Tax=Frankliniella fusca TaxID=407009 RepID=A0AAE1HNF8_9NEOP|nr:Protocadherin gamma-A2 [Frankliniella fusca]